MSARVSASSSTRSLRVLIFYFPYLFRNILGITVTPLPAFNDKEIKNASQCIVELCKHAGIFKNTREVHREARGATECFSYVYHHFEWHTIEKDIYEMLRKSRALKLVT